MYDYTASSSACVDKIVGVTFTKARMTKKIVGSIQRKSYTFICMDGRQMIMNNYLTI